MMNRLTLLLGALVVWAAPVWAQVPGQGNPNQEKQAAIAAMIPWLQQIDGGDYVSAWRASDLSFRQKNPADQWVPMMRAVRAPFGPALRRSVSTAMGQPIAPARGGIVQGTGYFVIAQFDSYFPNQKHATENVCFEKGLDGMWHAAGYSIQQKSP